LAKVASLSEIEKHWSINDLADANEALDIKDEVEAHMMKEAKEKARTK